MKTTLKNLKNNNTETFNYIVLKDIEDFVNKELRIGEDIETGFTFLYKTLGELSFQTEKIQKYIIDGLIYDLSKITEPNEKDRYNLCLLRLLENIDNIIEWNDYIGEDEDTFFIEHIECYSKMKASINIISFLKALGIEMTTTEE